MPVNVAYLSDRLTTDHIAAFNRVHLLIGHDERWTAWLEEVGLRDVSGSGYLEVDDRDKVYRVVRGNSLTYKVDAGRIVDAAERGRVVSEWLAILGEMFDYWAEKKQTPPHPPLPDPDASLPPDVEERLAALRADQILEAAHDDHLAELIDEDNDN